MASEKILSFILPEGDTISSMTPIKWASLVVSFIKYLISTFLFVVCVVVAMTLAETPLKIIFIWVLILYLATIEGGQVAMVSLTDVPRSSYADSHKIAAKTMNTVKPEGSLEKYIMGRQFLVVIVIFLLALVSSGSNTCSVVTFGFLTSTAEALCSSGLTLTFVTIMVGQITSQIVASSCRLDFINNYLMWINSLLSLAIEYSGILHTVHLVRLMINGRLNDDEEASSGESNVLCSSKRASVVFFWSRVILSLFLLCFSLSLVFHEVLLGHTNSFGSLPGPVNVLIVFIFMGIIGLCEGMQIALCALADMNIDELREKSPTAAANCQLTFGRNLESFLIGRQMFVTVFVFFVAGTTTVADEWTSDNSYTTFHLGGHFVQAVLTSGLPASLITTILASLVFRIAASRNPIGFLSYPIVGPAIRICLIVERTGIMQFSWVIAKLFMWLLRFEQSTIVPNEKPNGSVNSAPDGDMYCITIAETDQDGNVGSTLVINPPDSCSKGDGSEYHKIEKFEISGAITTVDVSPESAV